MIKRILLVVALVLASIGIVGGPAQADTSGELLTCEYNAAAMWDANYTVVFGGVTIGVTATRDWQYVGGSSSGCEDINVAPVPPSLWTAGIIKVRTHFCPSSGAPCYFNAWRNCQGGCQAATDVSNGTKYSIHFAGLESSGNYIQLYD